VTPAQISSTNFRFLASTETQFRRKLLTSSSISPSDSVKPIWPVFVKHT
jgi:hypothetical protein